MMLFLLQLWNELRKMFARKRTYIGFGAFFVVECGMLFLLNLPKPRISFQHLIERNGYGFEEYYSGLTLALMMVIWTTTLARFALSRAGGRRSDGEGSGGGDDADAACAGRSRGFGWRC